jgi:hypothetical protein
MSITHEEARRLIQFDTDRALEEQEQDLLHDHLAGCTECSEYARQVHKLELTLVSVMQRRWNVQPLPSPAQTVSPGRKSQLLQNMLFATRIAAMGVICITFLFNIWHFTQSPGQSPNPVSSSAAPVPTPSILSTTTNAAGPDCELVSYKVQEHDTLQRVASQFSVPPEAILTANHLDGNMLVPSMNLSIPLCGQTPGTPRTATITFTPLLTSTPVNQSTQ